MPTKYRQGFVFAFALSLAGLLAGWSVAQDDPIEARMRKDITYLASDECEGRGVGTKGLDLAADYIAAEFKKAGLKPGGVNGTYFQPFPFATNAKLDGESTLALTGPQGQKIMLKQGVDFQVLGFSAPGKLTAPLVFAGYGTTALTIDYDDYKGLDVKGKAVVTLRRLPRWTSKELPFDGVNKDDLAALDSKQIRAQVNGGAAVILVNDATEMPNDDLASFGTTAKGISTVSIPFVQIKRSVIDDILRSSTGKGLADTEKAIDADLKPRSAALKGWSIALDVKVKREETPVKNVIGFLEGNGPLANETIVIGAHYDHLGYGGFGAMPKRKEEKEPKKDEKDAKKKTIYYGADDNGSGSTAVMELSRRFGAMKDRQGRRLVFMTFTAEERGLIGSRHYTKVAPLFPLKDTAAMVNLDMVGRLKPGDNTMPPKLLVEGVDTAKEFDALLAKLNPGFTLIKEKSAFGASDHFSFYQQKIPVVFFWTGTHPDYHRPGDTADKINVAGMKQITGFAESVVKHLSTEAKRPEYVQVKTPFKMGGGAFPKLGILPDYTFGGKGVLLEGITDNGPAALGGLKKGDVIVEMAGKGVTDVSGYMAVLQAQKSGVAIEIKLLRDGKEMKMTVTPK